MKESSYDLAVAYRIFPKMSSNPPPIFGDDKFKLSELCLRSLKNSVGNMRVKLWALLNLCPQEYEDLFISIWGKEDLVLLRYDGIPPSDTLKEEFRILMEQDDAEICYLVEDDYFHLPGQFPLAVDFLKQNPDADFATTYDHPELHTTDLHHTSHEVRKFGGKEWHSRISATHTFLAKRSALVETWWLFHKLYKTYQGSSIPDLAMWMALTKKRVFNPFKFVQWSLTNRFWAASVFLAWFRCWRQILFHRKYTLWTPHPSIATHMITTLVAPDINWQKEFQKQIAASPGR